MVDMVVCIFCKPGKFFFCCHCLSLISSEARIVILVVHLMKAMQMKAMEDAKLERACLFVFFCKSRWGVFELTILAFASLLALAGLLCEAF